MNSADATIKHAGGLEPQSSPEARPAAALSYLSSRDNWKRISATLTADEFAEVRAITKRDGSNPGRKATELMRQFIADTRKRETEAVS